MSRLRWSAVPLIVLAVASLACGGGPATVQTHQADTCGQLRATVQLPRAFTSRSVSVWEGDARLSDATVPGATTEADVAAYLGGDRTAAVEIRAGRTVIPLTVQTPPWTLDLGWSPPLAPFPEDSAPFLDVTLLGPCADLSMLAVSASIEGGPPVVTADPVGDRRAIRFTLPQLAQGTHALLVDVADARGSVASARIPFVVGPPCVDVDGDGVRACDGDCDDRDPSVHPGAVDIRGNGIDDDCDGANGQDLDRDGYESRSAGGTDCDDKNPRVYPGRADPPDADGDGAYAWKSLDYDCDGVATDAPGPWDCDDADPHRPQPELATPNSIDDDCDGIVDEGTVAYDDDGDGQTELAGDCDDDDVTVWQGARELGDCRDNDCDGVADEGVTRPTKDDRYEPNDERAYELPGAVKRGRFLGIDTGYHGTHAELVLVTRDRSDTETFSVWSHDGPIDDWHVTASVAAIGDGRTYEIVIEGNGRRTSGVVSRRGESVQLLGGTGRNDTGTYTVSVRPLEGDLLYCPLQLVISSG